MSKSASVEHYNCVGPRYLSAHDAVKFSVLVGLAAIFIDAVIAHGLFWENDPYWTYWVTKTFLITTVFSIGNAFFGIGIKQGLIITAVHTLILEIYYQWFAPVGLPQEPEWLDFNKLWVTGIPAHYLAIICGYFIALWIWRRNHYQDNHQNRLLNSASAYATYALVATLLAVLIDTIITHIALRGYFPGLTHLIQNTLTGFVFIFVWSIYVGTDILAWLVGSGMLALVWLAYSMYLGPLGYPGSTPLGSTQAATAAEGISTVAPQYLGFNALWFKAFPGAFIAALIALAVALIVVRLFIKKGWLKNGSALIVALCTMSALHSVTAPGTEEGYSASASAQGSGVMVVGPNPVDMKSTQPLEGFIKVSVKEMGERWSHIQNLDIVNVVSEFTSGGSQYKITINKTMPRHPLGKYALWNGVVFRHPMHGHTGIGTDKLPQVSPDIALWGWAEVMKDGKLLNKMAPAHLMVMTEKSTQGNPELKGIMLEISSEEKELVGVPDGYITVMWHTLESFKFPEDELWYRQLIGWIALISITLIFGLLAALSGTPCSRHSDKRN